MDIIIIGAGFAGAATAFHLARRGRTDVLILERESVAGVHSSGRHAGIIREYVEEPALRSIVSASAAVLRSGELAAYERRGIMLMNQGDEDVSRYFPPARGRGAWCPQDGTIDAGGLLTAYLAGCNVAFNTEVTGWEERDGRMVVSVAGPILPSPPGRGVGGEGRQIVCNLLVNAAGPWAGEIGRLPLQPTNRHLFVTTPLPWVDPAWPTVWDGPAGLYFRPESGGLLLCACDETPARPGEYVEDAEVLADLSHKLSAMQPGLGELAVQRSWVGQRTFAPDRRFVIGFDPRFPRLFHVAALGGHGVTSSYEVGRIAASLIDGDSSAAPAAVSALRAERLTLREMP